MTTERLSALLPGLERAVQLLLAGELVALPSETVYGLAADATAPESCLKIFAAKQRPLSDPLIIHVTDAEAASAYGHLDPQSLLLARTFWPGPLTLIVPKTDRIDPRLTAQSPTVALRAPAHPVFRQVLSLCGRPLAAPSANPFGYVSPTTADHVLSGLDGRIAAVVDAGPCPLGLESTIVRCTPGEAPRILRPGSLSVEALEAVLGTRPAVTSRTAQPVPGALPWHYSPATPAALCRHEEFAASLEAAPAGTAYLRFSETGAAERGRGVVLPIDDAAAAAALFSALRRLDAFAAPKILLSLPPDDCSQGLWPAIRDRLTKASGRHSHRTA